MDNTTPLRAGEYDANIEDVVPFYTAFYKQAVDVVTTVHSRGGKWLDTGCGTGGLISMAAERLPNFHYVLCDPSRAMIAQAKAKLSHMHSVLDYQVCSSQQLRYDNEFEVVTAIQSHHYMQYADRVLATQNCYGALKKDGIYILFENFAPDCQRGKSIVMDRWGRYQKNRGKTDAEVAQHRQRYATQYFPITLQQHTDLLSKAGFSVIQLLWLSYMQVGFYAIK